MMEPLLFYGLACFILAFSLGVLFSKNPIFSAFCLAAAMVGLAGVFFGLGAYFISAVQLAVYAGAVMVLFVIVLMIFDIQKESTRKSEQGISRLFKITLVGIILGIITGGITLSGVFSFESKAINDPASMASTKALAIGLFDNYLLEFEVLGVLLLAIAVGVVSVSRIKGGTHAKS